MSLPRPEYPRPQFARADWLCLNGTWQFEFDHGDSGLERGLRERDLAAQIVVPFCPESKLSGVEHTDFLHAIWYRRTVDIPGDWAGRRVLLHCGAVDYDATVWANGREVGRHRGGFTPFTCDLGGVVRPGEAATIVVRARDNPHQAKPCGKQSNHRFANAGCHYTRTTGIWQTVWLEPVPERAYLLRARITPDVANSRFLITQPIRGRRPGLTLHAVLRDEQREFSEATAPADADFSPAVVLPVPASRRRLWSPRDPHLYVIEIALRDESGRVVDQVCSYAGLRSVTLDGPAVKINGERVFQRLVLDQGFYPDGILTAPSDVALRRDITLAMEAGFNGARLHQKVFEERFLYHADQLGYLVWGEFGDWGLDRGDPKASYVAQWIETLERDFSHPSIVGWCPLNETAEEIRDALTGLDDLTRALFLATKAMDPTRPVLDASGYSHRVAETDVYDNHDYEPDPAKFAGHFANLVAGQPPTNGPADRPWSVSYCGQPFFCSEFGGIWWNPDAKPGEDSWGYGDRPQTIEEFYNRFEKLCAAQLEHPRLLGYCYTQLTDVFQEQNGIYFFDRRPKFDLARLRKAQQRRAAIEIAGSTA